MLSLPVGRKCRAAGAKGRPRASGVTAWCELQGAMVRSCRWDPNMCVVCTPLTQQHGGYGPSDHEEPDGKGCTLALRVAALVDSSMSCGLATLNPKPKGSTPLPCASRPW